MSSDSPRTLAVAGVIGHAYQQAAAFDATCTPAPLDLARQVEDKIMESDADLRRRVEELRDELFLAALAHSPTQGRDGIPAGVLKLLSKIDDALDTSS